MEVFTIVYPVAGMSTRFGGRIKQFADVGPDGEVLIEYSMNQAIAVGFNRIIFIVGEKTEVPFRERFGDSYRGVPISYVKQVFDSEVRDKPWGTCDALCTIRDVIDSPFVMCNGDDIYGEGAFRILIDHLRDESIRAGTLGYNIVETLPDEGGGNRAIYSLSDDSHVMDMKETFNIEKNDLEKHGLNESDVCSMNIFALHPEVVYELDKLLTQFKEENKENRTAECLLPVELANLIKYGKIKMACYPTDEKWFGVTHPDDEDVVREQLRALKE